MINDVYLMRGQNCVALTNFGIRFSISIFSFLGCLTTSNGFNSDFSALLSLEMVNIIFVLKDFPKRMKVDWVVRATLWSL